VKFLWATHLLIGIIGPKEDAKAIKDKIETFLQNELYLELSEEKTGIIHGKQATLFLGYEVGIETCDKTLKVKQHGSYATTRTIRAMPTLRVPKEKVKKFCETKGYGKWEEMKFMHRPNLAQLSDLEIISIYNSELRGIANYYAMATDVKTKLNKMFYMAHVSLVKTLANKHKTTNGKIFSQLRATTGLALKYIVKGKTKLRKVFKLSELKKVPINYRSVDEIPYVAGYFAGTELLRRWNAQECEICRKDKGYFEVHHIRKLSDIKDGKQPWQKLMIARARKTLVLCVECHDLLHAGKLLDWRFKGNRMESRVL
jgi:Type II intron maturase